jgi:membrane-bound lytic murein transglycosylase A
MSFSRFRLPLALSAFALALALAACSTTPLPPAPVAAVPPVAPATPATPVPVTPVPTTPSFVPVSFAALPGWDKDEVRAVWPAFMRSCGVLAKRADWAEACSVARTVNGSDEQAVRLYFETFFIPNQVRAPDGADTGLITGYYEPLLHGAHQRGGRYQTPLYAVPADMITVDLASVYPELKGMRLRGRLVGNKLVPYATRAEIADKAPPQALMWVDDPVEAFFLEVQGSGRVQLDDTRETVRIAYADQNGYPYKSIGKYLVEQGELTVAQASAQGIKAWIVANPTRRQELFNANRSYVFFKEERLPDASVGPKGALGVPLTPKRSVAIDPHMLPLGAPIFLATTEANSAVPMQRLVMGQDTGGAIRGAVRADFFFGFGGDAAENAGRMKQAGQLWVLLPKPAAAAAQATAR